MAEQVYNSPLPPAQWMLAELVDVLTEQARGRVGWTLDGVVVSGDGTDAQVEIMFWGTEFPPEGGGTRPVQIRAKLDIRVAYVAPPRRRRE